MVSLHTVPAATLRGQQEYGPVSSDGPGARIAQRHRLVVAVVSLNPEAVTLRTKGN